MVVKKNNLYHKNKDLLEIMCFLDWEVAREAIRGLLERLPRVAPELLMPSVALLGWAWAWAGLAWPDVAFR